MRKGFAAALVFALAVPMMRGVSQLPRPGAPDGPVHTHVSAAYIDGGAAVGGAENLVTAVLLNYRALDTLGEVLVIFCAWLAVIAAMVPAAGEREREGSVPVSPVVAYVLRILAPFIGAFGVFVIVNGHVLPGGGFQGGVVLGALVILLAVALGPGRVARALPTNAWSLLRASGVLVFAGVGLAGAGLSGHLFGLSEQPILREWLMILLEVAIGTAAAAVLAGLFLAMIGSDSP